MTTDPQPQAITLRLLIDLDPRERRQVADAAQRAAEARIALILEARRRDAALRERGHG